MTAAEAIKSLEVIKKDWNDYADNDDLYWKAVIILDSLDMAINALEKAEKYKWHDLRKDPTDLPEHNGKVNGKFAPYEVIYDERVLASCNHGFEYWQGDGWFTSWKIIKWREIDHEGDEE